MPKTALPTDDGDVFGFGYDTPVYPSFNTIPGLVTAKATPP